MKSKMHLKRRNKRFKLINVIIIIFILIFISVIYIINILSEKALPHLISYSEIETKKVISNVISSTVTEEISNKITMEDLFITTKSSNDSISSIDINSSKVNKLLSDVSLSIEKNLKYLETGQIDKINLSNNTFNSYDIDKLRQGIIYELPSGIIFDNILLNNIMPKIPVRINLIGNIFCVLNTDIESYGINNALIKVNISVEADVKILLPFISSTTKVTTNIPLIIKIIEGNVPSYYFDGYLNTPMHTENIN